MFKKFSVKESVTAHSQVKTSVARGIRSKIVSESPAIEPYIDDILPKKAPLIITKCQNYITMVTINNEPLFFRVREGPYYPTLRVLQKYPFILPHMQVDKGAIKFVLSGANIMSPGLTSAGGKMVDVPAETPVAIMAEGKIHPVAIGLTLLSTQQIRETNKGIAIENIHYLNDGLWKTEKLE
eukprot:TRINITY_DN13398_c0_g1_i1.p1 TRINITY_DN13398_c0_g1~~TRINITY_DN13398_c0_g1_i1.p1  ORF type:complete len:182 (+),score=37.18 TRINITY_DN13398_c0_g1_i1:172-717(+)